MVQPGHRVIGTVLLTVATAGTASALVAGHAARGAVALTATAVSEFVVGSVSSIMTQKLAHPERDVDWGDMLVSGGTNALFGLGTFYAAGSAGARVTAARRAEQRAVVRPQEPPLPLRGSAPRPGGGEARRPPTGPNEPAAATPPESPTAAAPIIPPRKKGTTDAEVVPHKTPEASDGERTGNRPGGGPASRAFTERELDLGRDPATGGKLRIHEVECATTLEERVGTLTRAKGQGDWVDANGRVYDGIGPIPEGKPYSIEKFMDSINDHLDSPNKNRVQEFVVDVRRLAPDEVTRVVERVESLRATTTRTINIQGR